MIRSPPIVGLPTMTLGSTVILDSRSFIVAHPRLLPSSRSGTPSGPDRAWPRGPDPTSQGVAAWTSPVYQRPDRHQP